ncbi:MAG: HlyC/CorC family transporter [Rhodothermaceae bacterium]|nr:HlyC/CorC family transporter [Rhodothermaceae bacterium]
MAILLILLMLGLSAFFSGSEIAFVTANRLRAEVRAQREGFLGGIVRGFLHDPPTFLTTTLVGNNIALVVYSTLMGLYLDGPLTGFWSSLVNPEGVTGLVLVSQTIIAAVLVLLFGEVIPKSLLREPSERLVFALAGPLKLTYWLFLPFIKIAGWASNQLVRLFGAPAESVQQFLRRDFELVIRESRETGSLDLDEEETEILENVFELRSLRVKDSMVPRTDIRAVEEGSPLDSVRATFIETGFSRLPIYRDNIDQIVGVVLAHDLFHEPESLAAIVRPVPVIPDQKPARDLLFAFLREGTTLAVVIDEYGGTAGIVTMEDLLEELFGDIQDEHDVDLAPMRRLDEKTVLVSGRSELEDLADQFAITLTEGDYETVAGFLLDHLGAIPPERESMEHEGYRFTILKASANRIEAVRITKL